MIHSPWTPTTILKVAPGTLFATDEGNARQLCIRCRGDSTSDQREISPTLVLGTLGRDNELLDPHLATYIPYETDFSVLTLGHEIYFDHALAWQTIDLRYGHSPNLGDIAITEHGMALCVTTLARRQALMSLSTFDFLDWPTHFAIVRAWRIGVRVPEDDKVVWLAGRSLIEPG